MVPSVGTGGPARVDRADRVEPRSPAIAPTMAAVTQSDLIRVHGGASLAGHVTVAGAKNSALKLMAAALLAPGRTGLTNVPRITDIAIMAEVLRRLGCEVHADDHDGITIDVPAMPDHETDYD